MSRHYKNRYASSLIQKFFISFIFITVIIFNAYGQEIPEEFFPEARLFDNNISNEEIAASLDKFKYKRGDVAKVFGYVLDYKSGERIFLEVKNSDGVVIITESIIPSSGGVFNAFERISSDAIPGTYVLTINYGKTGIPLSIVFDVEGIIQTLIHIPLGAEFKDYGLSFTPNVISVEEGVPIIWINDDNSVHTVVSGKKTLGDRMTSDGQFNSGIFGPADTYSISLFQGEYDYFCKLHPWLRGSLTVIPSTDPNYVVPESQEQEDESQIPSSLIDDSDVGFLTIRTEKDVYFTGQVVTFHGNVKIRESESPVSIRIFDPSGSIMEIKQVIPNQNNGFSFSITSSGDQYSKEGSYTVSAQYGLKEHYDETSFILTKKLLSETNYKGYSIYSGAVYYAIPFPEKDLEDILLTNLLKNPSFDKNPPIFNDFQYWSAPYLSFNGELDYSIKTSGDYSYRLSTISPTEASWSTVVSEVLNVQPGAVYEIEAKTKQENAVQSHINVLYFSNTDNQWHVLDFLQASTVGDKDWTKFTKEVTIPEDSNNLRILLNAGWVQDQLIGKATTWYDDIRVTRIGVNDANELVYTTEPDSAVTGWSAPYLSFNGELDYSIKTSGDYSYRLSTISPTEASWSTVVSEVLNVQPGAVYEIEAKTKQENAVQSHINVLYFSNTDNQWHVLAFVSGAIGGDKDWTKFTKEVTIPEDSNNLRILLNAGWVQDQLRGKATTWYDDIKVRQIATSDYNILVTGNSLEEIKTKIDQSPPVGPYLIESEYNEFDIVMYGGMFYASNQEGILFDTEKLENKENEILFADSLDSIKTMIENPITSPSIEIKIESELEEKQETIIEPDISKPSDTLEKDTIPILQIIVVIAVLSGAAIFVYHSLRKKKTTSNTIKS